jgi:hypothetical protein
MYPNSTTLATIAAKPPAYDELPEQCQPLIARSPTRRTLTSEQHVQRDEVASNGECDHGKSETQQLRNHGSIIVLDFFLKVKPSACMPNIRRHSWRDVRLRLQLRLILIEM